MAPNVRVDIPVVGAADWNWLQPYLNPPLPPISAAATDTSGQPRAAQPQTVFNAFKITQGEGGKGQGAQWGHDPTAKLPKGPYTALEGFLQLVEPIVVDEKTGNPTV